MGALITGQVGIVHVVAIVEWLGRLGRNVKRYRADRATNIGNIEKDKQGKTREKSERNWWRQGEREREKEKIMQECKKWQSEERIQKKENHDESSSHLKISSIKLKIFIIDNKNNKNLYITLPYFIALGFNCGRDSLLYVGVCEC